MNKIESTKETTPTVEDLYNMKFPNIVSAKDFLEKHNIPMIWPSKRSDGHIMTNANGKVGIGKLTEKRGLFGINLTGLAIGKIAYGDPNMSVEELSARNLKTTPDKNGVATSVRKGVHKILN